MKKIIPILFLFSLEMYSQSFKLGFDLESVQLRTSDQYGAGSVIYPLSGSGIHLVFNLIPTDEINVQTKIGRSLISPEFWGWEFGINGRYKFYKSLYMSAGVFQHSNEGGEVSNKLSISYASILFLNAGIGIEIFKSFGVEADYYIPMNKKEIEKRRGFFHDGIEVQNYVPIILEDMIRLSFIFGWEL